MQAKIATVLARLLLNYIRKHPQVIEAVLREIEKAIPGKADDIALEALVKLFLAL